MAKSISGMSVAGLAVCALLWAQALGCDAGCPSDMPLLEVAGDPQKLAVSGLMAGDAPALGGLVSSLEVGTLPGRDPGEYMDPAAPQAGVRWEALRTSCARRDGDAVVVQLADDRGSLTVRSAGKGTFEAALDVSGSPDVVFVRARLQGLHGPLYGFGETFDAVARKQGVQEMQLRVDLQSESGTNELHVPVPLAISREGVGVFAESRAVGAFDLSQSPPALTFADPQLKLVLFPAPAGGGGPDPLGVLSRYAARTGKPRVPPPWAFAPQQWRNQSTRDLTLADAAQLRTNQVPGSLMWIDNPWQTGYNTFQADPARYGDLPSLVSQLGAQGFNLLVWSTPYLNRDTSPLYQEAQAKGYFVQLAGGGPFVYSCCGAKDGSPIDFTAPGATDFWAGLARRAVQAGVAGFKLDFGEEAVPDVGGRLSPVRFSGGATAATLHGVYSTLYHDAYLQADPASFLLVRSGVYGGQTRASCVWPGDLSNDLSLPTRTTVGGLPAAIRGGLSLSASGYPFFASDIGGFRHGAPDKRTLLRWAEYAALLPIMQLGGGGDSHNPWDPMYDAETLAIYRAFAQLHMYLVPTFWALSARAGDTGVPVTVPLGLAFPGEPGAEDEDFEFMLGEALLVAPVIDRQAGREVFFPTGTWTDWSTGEVITGPQRRMVKASLEVLPLYQREGAVVGLFADRLDTLLPADKLGPGIRGLQGQEALQVRARPAVQPAPVGPGGTLTFTDGTAVVMETTSTGVRLTTGGGSLFNQVRWMLDLRSRPVPSQVALDGVPLRLVKDQTELMTCTGSCWTFDRPSATLHLWLRAPFGTVVIQ